MAGPFGVLGLVVQFANDCPFHRGGEGSVRSPRFAEGRCNLPVARCHGNDGYRWRVLRSEVCAMAWILGEVSLYNINI